VSAGVTGGFDIVVSVVAGGVVVSVPVDEPGFLQAKTDPANNAIKRMLFMVF
jgi:hypothetical protein